MKKESKADRNLGKALKQQALAIFGGPGAVANIFGIGISAVSQWDRIPAHRQKGMLDYAVQNNINFTPNDFFVLRDEYAHLLPHRASRHNSNHAGAFE